MEPKSMYHAAAVAASEHSARVVQRLGEAHEAASRTEWNRDRFWLWAIERVLEHVEGREFWRECGRRNFARAQQSASLANTAREVQALQRRLSDDALPDFRAKEQLIRKLADAANQLLE
jgi:hypothetical protein